jgi:plasmid stability protein
MATVTIRNLSDEVHRALRVRAASHGRSTEAEIRNILEATVRPPQRVKLGSLLASIAREAGALTDAQADGFDRLRERRPAEPPGFE